MRAGGISSAVFCCNGASSSLQAYLGGGAGVGLRLAYTLDKEPRARPVARHDALQRSSARTLLVVEGAVFPSLAQLAVRGVPNEDVPLEGECVDLAEELGALALVERRTSSLWHFIEIWYNRQRRHSSLGYRSPVEYESELQRVS